MSKFNTFFRWLHNIKGHSPATIETCARHLHIIDAWFKNNTLDLNKTEYKHLLQFIEYCREGRGMKPYHINQYIVVIQHYLNFVNLNTLNYVNPATDLRVLGTTIHKPFEVFSRSELDAFYNKYPIKGKAAKTCKIILGLIVYQAIRRRELFHLEPKHFDFEKGTIYIPGTRSSEGRTLNLEPNQIILLHEFISQNTKPNLFNQGNLNHFYRQLQKYYPQVQNTHILRNSVLVYWVKNNNLRTAQYMAGHKLVASTERYKQDDLEGLQQAVNEFHPLG